MAGSRYFVSTKSLQNTAPFQVHTSADIIVAKLLHYRDIGAYQLHAFVLMPNRLHLVLTPGGATTLEKRCN
jgi:putative transposase